MEVSTLCRHKCHGGCHRPHPLPGGWGNYGLEASPSFVLGSDCAITVGASGAENMGSLSYMRICKWPRCHIYKQRAPVRGFLRHAHVISGGSHTLPWDHHHQCTGGCSHHEGDASVSHLNAVPPRRLPATGEMMGPLPTGPARMVPRAGVDPCLGALPTPMGTKLLAGPQPFLGLVH